MALQSYTLAVGNLQDDEIGNNYAVNKPVYILKQDRSLQPIFSDLAGATPIIQDGANNATNQRGEFSFFVESGDYIASVGGIERALSIGSGASIEDLKQTAIYPSLSSLINTTDVLESGKLAKTIVNNSDTNMGGAEYKIMTTAEYMAETGNATPDGEVISGRHIGMDHYVGGGTELVAKYNMSIGFDRAAGVIGDDRILGKHDDLPALHKLVDWANKNSPLDEGKLQKGYKKTFFHPRSSYYTNGSLDLRNARTDYDFNQSIIYPMTATSPALLWEGIFCELSNLLIEGLTELTRHDWESSGEALIEWGKDEPVHYSNGSHVSFARVIARGGYHTFKLNSVDSVDASYIWGSNFKNCYFQDAVEYCYYFNSPFETSTTMTWDTCHARCVSRDAVTIGEFDYFCIRHHVSDTTNEPEVGVDWKLYWTKKDKFVDRGDWVSGQKYLTQAKGFYFFNVSSVSLLGCSQDGGVNTVNGTAVNYTGQFLYVDRFHFESGNHEEVNTNKFFYISGDFYFGELLIATHRYSLPADEKAYFIGGPPLNINNNKRAIVLNATNKSPVLIDDNQNIPIWMDCAGFLSVDLGPGIPLNAVENVTGSTTAQRGITKQIVKPLISGVSVFSFAPDRRDNGVKFVTGDGINKTNLTVQLDNYAYLETTDFNSNPQYDSYSFEFFVRASNGTGSLDFVGLNGALFIGETNYPEGVTVRATKVSASSWLLEQVSVESGGGGDGWVEFIPQGQYASGTFTIPNSKTLNDIAEIRISGSRGQVYGSTSFSFIEGAFDLGSSFGITNTPDSSANTNYIKLTFADENGTSGTLSKSGSVYLRGASVKFK